MNGDPVNFRSQSRRSPGPAPVPLERYYRAADVLAVLASARKLALLDVLSRRGGAVTLGEAVYEGGMATHGALRDAAELEALGLVTVIRPTGRNLSEQVEITLKGLCVPAFAELMTEPNRTEPNRTELPRGHEDAEDE